MFKYTSIAVIAALTTAPAFAGGLAPVIIEPSVEDTVYVAPSVDWTGGYVGGSLSGGQFDDGTTPSDTRGFGLQAGYLNDMGRFVLGGELAYLKSDLTETGVDGDFTSTRLKGIAGFNAGRVLPYALIGVSQVKLNGAADASDTVPIYGLGLRYAVNDNWTAGLEYVVESKDDFDDTGLELDNKDLSLRIDYRF